MDTRSSTTASAPTAAGAAATLPPAGRTNGRDRDGAAARHDRRSVAGLFSDLWRETTTLVHEEAELAKADMSEKVSQALRAGGAIAVGGAIAFAGFLVLLLAAVSALAPLLPPEHAAWLAPLIVGGVVLIVGLIALSGGRRRLDASNLKPSRSMASLARDRRMVEEHLQ